MNLMRFGLDRTLRGLRRGDPPGVIAFWFALSAYGFVRSRQRPPRELLRRINLQPGQSYRIAVTAPPSKATRKPKGRVMAENGDADSFELPPGTSVTVTSSAEAVDLDLS